MKHLSVLYGLLFAPLVAAESYVCPAELLEEGLLKLQRSGDGFVLTHGVLGTRPAGIIGEDERYLCTGVAALDEETPGVYVFCVDKKEKTIAVRSGTPYGIDTSTDTDSDPDSDEEAPFMESWSHSRCFVSDDTDS